MEYAVHHDKVCKKPKAVVITFAQQMIVMRVNIKHSLHNIFLLGVCRAPIGAKQWPNEIPIIWWRSTRSTLPVKQGLSSPPCPNYCKYKSDNSTSTRPKMGRYKHGWGSFSCKLSDFKHSYDNWGCRHHTWEPELFRKARQIGFTYLY